MTAFISKLIDLEHLFCHTLPKQSPASSKSMPKSDPDDKDYIDIMLVKEKWDKEFHANKLIAQERCNNTIYDSDIDIMPYNRPMPRQPSQVLTHWSGTTKINTRPSENAMTDQLMKLEQIVGEQKAILNENNKALYSKDYKGPVFNIVKVKKSSMSIR